MGATGEEQCPRGEQAGGYPGASWVRYLVLFCVWWEPRIALSKGGCELCCPPLCDFNAEARRPSSRFWGIPEVRKSHGDSKLLLEE